jgi:hypothetical protein
VVTVIGVVTVIEAAELVKSGVVTVKETDSEVVAYGVVVVTEVTSIDVDLLLEMDDGLGTGKGLVVVESDETDGIGSVPVLLGMGVVV